MQIRHIIIDDNGSASTNIVDDLAEIDMAKDAVIVFQSAAIPPVHEVEFKNDEFIINSVESIRPKIIPGTNQVQFTLYCRFKMTLPHGVFPQFESGIPGLQIVEVSQNKFTGVMADDVIHINDQIFSITGKSGFYTLYQSMCVELEVFRASKFNTSKFPGLTIPYHTPFFKFRLVPHFVQNQQQLRDVYIICSKYIYDRLPNM